MRKETAALIILALLAAFCSLSLLPVKAESRTIVVPDDYAIIQTAVDKASLGDTVLVKSGTYYQNVTINKQLSFIGEKKEKKKINCTKKKTPLYKDTPN